MFHGNFEKARPIAISCGIKSYLGGNTKAIIFGDGNSKTLR